MRNAYRATQQTSPFETIAICILPDHLHAVWQLPSDDADFTRRWSMIKSSFSRGLAATPSRTASKVKKREKGIWQRRYWEHAIRDDSDLNRHVDYIHFNPVRHGLVARVCDWPHSSFHRYVSRGDLPLDWGVTCANNPVHSANEPRGHGASRLCPPYGDQQTGFRQSPACA